MNTTPLNIRNHNLLQIGNTYHMFRVFTWTMTYETSVIYLLAKETNQNFGNQELLRI